MRHGVDGTRVLASQYAGRVRKGSPLRSGLGVLQSVQLLTHLALTLGLLITVALSAAEPVVDASQMPRIAPTEPAKALSTIKVRPGFRMELVAAEPLVVSPVAMAFDENGRLFVVEMIDYSERRDEKLGRVRMLEDTDGDGIFDKSTVYVEALPWPTAVICYNGGIFVGATPDIIYCKDTDGDGKADIREVVFTGFASAYAPYRADKLNVQAMFNSFHWGLDNRIHGAGSLSGGAIQSVKHPSLPIVELRGRDFSFDPRELVIRPETGGAQHGMSFDDFGRKFLCSNSDHIQLAMYDDRYVGRNRRFNLPPPRVSIAVDGPAAEVYRLSPDEPWRVIRTKWRATGVVPGLVEGGGRPSGYFTGATGTTIYRGNAFPSEYLGDAFVADCGSNLIHRKKLRPDGVLLKAERAADEQKSEFAASTDNWFRPVQFANAPDGTLYVADMYRETIEHPWSLPANIKRHLDLNSGNDRGRIYRIVPDGFKQPAPVRLGKLSVRELVSTLEHPNGWHRDTAARLLWEREDLAAVPFLRELLRKSKSPLGRLHALYALDGLRQLQPGDLLAGLDDDHPGVRRHALRLAEPILAQTDIPGSFWRRLKRLADDPDPLTRYQLAFSLGQVAYDGKPRLLGDLAARDFPDPWMQAAILNSLTEGQSAVFERLARDRKVLSSPAGLALAQRLARLIGGLNDAEETSKVLATAEKTGNPAWRFELIAALDDGLEAAGVAPDKTAMAARHEANLGSAATTAHNAHVSEPLRLAALRLLGHGKFERDSPAILEQLQPAQPQAIQLAALAALGRYPDARVGREIVNRWNWLTPRLRSEAISVLLARAERIPALFDAIETGAMQRADVPTPQVVALRSYRDPAIQQRAMRLFAESDMKGRIETVKQFLPALALPGQRGHGRTLFAERCQTCHRLEGQGFSVGPDLASTRANGREKLLISILDPNREVAPNFLNYVVETKAGETLTGIIANESAVGITLRRANGDETSLERDRIGRIKSLDQSLMPEGLESGLSHQDMADLLEYIINP